MHGPTGCSGVQVRPKSGQLLGAMAPRSTSPQRHPRGSTVVSTGTSKRVRASKRENSGRMEKARVGNRPPQPAPRGVAWLKHLLDQLARHGVAVCVDATAVGVVDCGLPLNNHLDQHADALQNIDRLKSGDYAWGLELIDQKVKGG